MDRSPLIQSTDDVFQKGPVYAVDADACTGCRACLRIGCPAIEWRPATDGSKKLYLIEPDPAGFKPLASAELLESGENWAPIALVDGKLLIRDQKNLKCLEVAEQSRVGPK